MEILHTASEVRELATKEIENRVREARSRLREIRFKGVTERIENTAEPSQIRRMIARCLAVIGERRAEEQAKAAGAKK